MAFAIIEVDTLVVRAIIADYQIEVGIAVKVCESRSIGAIRRATDLVALLEPTGTVVEEDEVHQGPMASLGENNIEVAVTIEIPEASVGASLSGLLKRHASIALTIYNQCTEQQSADS